MSRPRCKIGNDDVKLVRKILAKKTIFGKVLWISVEPFMFISVQEMEEIKVSARINKGEFSKFSISKRSDKFFFKIAFFKKNSTKNIISVQSYRTLKFTTR